MPDVNYLPKDISASRKTRQLQITWSDGHVSVFPFGLLRAACPCAVCRGGHENMSPEPDPDVFFAELPDSAETRLSRLEAVGSYALTIEWEDGHHYGIYNWHYLRALCPCEVCRAGEST
jgi:DUF971 family protein